MIHDGRKCTDSCRILRRRRRKILAGLPEEACQNRRLTDIRRIECVNFYCFNNTVKRGNSRHAGQKFTQMQIFVALTQKRSFVPLEVGSCPKKDKKTCKYLHFYGTKTQFLWDKGRFLEITDICM